MKVSAGILLVSLIAFVVETIKLPADLIETKKDNTHACCKMKSAHDTCTKSPAHSSKPADCSHSTKCIDCPLCAVFFVQQVNNLSVQPNLTAREYSILEIHLLPGYCTGQWKPPDIA